MVAAVAWQQMQAASGKCRMTPTQRQCSMKESKAASGVTCIAGCQLLARHGPLQECRHLQRVSDRYSQKLLLGCSTLNTPHVDGGGRWHTPDSGARRCGQRPSKARQDWLGAWNLQLEGGGRACARVGFGMPRWCLQQHAGATPCWPASPNCQSPTKHSVCCRLGLGQVRQGCLRCTCTAFWDGCWFQLWSAS